MASGGRGGEKLQARSDRVRSGGGTHMRSKGVRMRSGGDTCVRSGGGDHVRSGNLGFPLPF